MALRYLIIITGISLLTACFPAKEMTRDNAENIIAASSQIRQISIKTAEGFTHSEINNQILKTMLLSSASTLSGDCKAPDGHYLLSKSGTDKTFSMVFDNCQSNNDTVIDGTLNGQFSKADDVYSFDATGDLTASRHGDTIAFKPLELSVNFDTREPEPSLSISQNGRYQFDTRLYRGTITAETIEPVAINTSTLEVSGHVQYRDEKGNRLDIEHDNNGVHLSLNGNLFISYSHNEWSNKLN